MARLTPKQEEVFSLMKRGYSNKEIANILEITEGTAKLHVSKVTTEMGIKSRLRLVSNNKP